jgi:hypothetical protein
LRYMEDRPCAEILAVPHRTAKAWVSRGRSSMLFALAKGNQGNPDHLAVGTFRDGAVGSGPSISRR